MEQKLLSLYTEIVALFAKGLVNRRLYYASHPRMEEAVANIVDLVGKYTRQSGADLFIGVYQENFIFAGKRVLGPTVSGKAVLLLADQLGCGGFTLRKSLDIDELKRFFDMVALLGTGGMDLEEARALFAAHTIENIILAAPYQGSFASNGEQEQWRGEELAEGFPLSVTLRRELFDTVAKAIDAAGMGVPIDVTRTRSVSEFMLQHIHSSFEVVLQSAAYPDFENYTVNHSIRVAALAVYAASQMGWGYQELLAIGIAALLHDIGKCAIPDDILMKKGRLTRAEFDIIRNHPRVGAEILVQQRELAPYTLAACWGHHIRYDGGGYPDQTEWAVRHPVSSLLQICDVFEALTAVRPYKEPMAPEKAFTIMLKDTGAFHPALLASFIKLVGLYPPGTLVKLADGRYGMVVSQTEELDRPNIRINIEKKGRLLGKEEQYMIDLTEEARRDVRVERLVLRHNDMMEVFDA